jgi:hypothetical protein
MELCLYFYRIYLNCYKFLNVWSLLELFILNQAKKKKGKMLLCLWASPLPHLAQLGNMVQPALTSRPMDEAGEVLPWHAGGGGWPIPARAGDKVAGKLF